MKSLIITLGLTVFMLIIIGWQIAVINQQIFEYEVYDESCEARLFLSINEEAEPYRAFSSFKHTKEVMQRIHVAKPSDL